MESTPLNTDPRTKWDMGNHPLFKQLEKISPQPEAEVDKLLTKNTGMLVEKPSNRWLRYSNAVPEPNMLFSEFWREGEVCILFSDTNLGKSILGMQIANSISRGEAIEGFKLESRRQPVLYFDFELSAKQFEARYSCNFENHYIFDDEFSRVEIDPNPQMADDLSFEENLRNSVAHSIRFSDAKVVIIDNITFLKDESRRTTSALQLMKQLKALKNKYKLSVLVLAHTARRVTGKPVSWNDVQGSKAMMQFCDSAFCIGESIADRNLRYLKQIKTRSTREPFGADNVVVCQVVKPGNFLKFEVLHYGMEWELLKGMMDEARSEMIARIIKKSGEGKNQRQIAAEVGVSPATVNRYLKSQK